MNNPHLPRRYYIKSKHDFGQHGVVFKTPYCAEIWVDLKFGKGGFKEGLEKGKFTVETVEFVYYPCPSNPNIQGC
jgi:hypothetical protein